MPAILTHDFFGRDLLDRYGQIENSTIDELDAFLLGNQGPDPLFFLIANPTRASWRSLGSAMHTQKPTELIFALAQSLNILDGREREIGRAYAQGFLCHYVLDSTAHPLVYATQHAICDAGVEGLGRERGGDVHAEIERELDELVLFTKRGETVRSYAPADNTLDACGQVLDIVQKIYAYLALTVYGQIIDSDVFPAAVRSYRNVLRALYSPTGVKRMVLGALEQRLRQQARLAAMSHRTEEVHSSWYANPDRKPWVDPFTGRQRRESFDDLYHLALDKAAQAIASFESGKFSLEDARLITGELNFSGEPTVATIVVES